jgi:hypothetical protein
LIIKEDEIKVKKAKWKNRKVRRRMLEEAMWMNFIDKFQKLSRRKLIDPQEEIGNYYN